MLESPTPQSPVNVTQGSMTAGCPDPATRPMLGGPALAEELHRRSPEPEIRRLRLGVLAALAMLFLVVIPLLNIGVPALGIPAGTVENHNLNRLGRYLCFAIAALGVDLIWGYTGLLSLCQAFFFCLGGYAMAMFLSLPQGGGDVRPEYHNIPQFFFFNNRDTLPLFWKPFASFPFALAAAIVIPAGVAGVFGYFIFRSRVRGVYFSIITQAVAWGAFLAFCRNEMLMGGTNGLTNFYKPLNQQRGWIVGLYLLTCVTLLAAYWICRHIVGSRLGRVLVAIRDKETRLNFAGYRPHLFKVFAFATGAALAALGGILYAPQTGIITPNIMKVEDSITMVIWVALGGRGKLWGAIFGTLLVCFSFSTLTSDMPKAWPFIQGAMFLAVVLLFPGGFVGMWDSLERQVARGAKVRGPVIGVACISLFLLLERRGAWPAFLGTSTPSLWQLKYALLALALGATYFSTGPWPTAAISFSTIALFVLAEAFGFMPAALQQAVIPASGRFDAVPLKYLLLLAMLALTALHSGAAQALYRRVLPAKPQPETASAGVPTP